jgi:integrase/recombinase XerD
LGGEEVKMGTEEAIQHYLKWCEDQGKSKNTIRQYAGRLRLFAQECPDLPLHTPTIELYLRRRKETPGHRGMHFKVLQAFYKYLEDVEGITSPVPPKGQVGRPTKAGRLIHPEQWPPLSSTPPSIDNRFSEEGPKKVYAPVNTADAIERYIRFKAAEGSSVRTQAGYRSRLYPFARIFPIVPVDVDEIAHFLGSIEGKQAGRAARRKETIEPETRFDYRKHLIAFYRWLEKRKEIPEVTPMFPRVKLPPKVRRVLSPEEMGRLFAFAEEPWMKAALTLLIDSKVRATELCTLTLENTFPDHIIVRGKTGQRSAPISRDTYDILLPLAEAAAARQKAAKENPEAPGAEVAAMGYLFTINTLPGGYPSEPRQMNREYLRVQLKKLMQRAGLDGKKLGPHILRHSASVQHIMFGGDLVSLQGELGHTTTRQTEKYAALAGPQVQEIHDRVNVLGHITGKDNLFRAQCFGCDTEIKVKLEDVRKTVCPKCGQKGKWYLPEATSLDLRIVNQGGK